MKKIVMCKGLPASGKSTWAKEFVKGKKDWVRVNNDELTAMLFGEPFAEGRSTTVDHYRKLIIKDLMVKKLNIVVDNTNLHPKHFEFLTKLIEEYNQSGMYAAEPELYALEVKDFTDVTLEECLKRNKKRENPVPDFVIKKMFNDYVRKKDFKLVQDPKLPKAIIVDIDGTVADLNGRNPHIITNCKADLPITEIIDIVKRYATDHKVIFVSGRDGKARQDTKEWLSTVAGFTPASFILYMKEDRGPDTDFKKTIFDKYIRDKFYISFVLEDRDRMVQTYRNEIGLPCLQVADGAF